MRSSTSLVLCVTCLLVAVAHSAYGWLRPRYEDATVVERSELIVVGRLDQGSIRYVPHDRGPNEGRSWEHHASLLVSEVLKGVSDTVSIPIVIHYGLHPVVGGRVERDGFFMDLRQGNENYPTERIAVMDTGSSAVSSTPLVADASEDNIWFLRRRSGVYGRQPGTGNLGIVDPEDLQPLQLKDYFLLYLEPESETLVKKHAASHPNVAQRAQRYLDHIQVQRIKEIQDVRERFEQILPYYLKRVSWDSKWVAKDGIMSCGDIAGAYFLSNFDDPTLQSFRREIILMWRDLGYSKAAPKLIELLKQHDQFWAEQELENGWWNKNVSSTEAQTRRNIYGEVYYAVAALKSFGDPTARDAIMLTKQRWEQIDFDNRQIVEECEAALKRLGVEK